MAGFRTQFHATPDELAAFVAEIRSANTLHVFLETVGKSELTYLPPNAILSATEAVTPLMLFVVKAEPPKAFRFFSQVFEYYDSILVLDVGNLSDGILEQSALSSMSDDRDWQAINRTLKRITVAGTRIVGEDGPLFKSFRFTRGAKQLFDQGIKIRSAPKVFHELPDFDKWH